MAEMQTNIRLNGDSLIVTNTQDCTPIAEICKRLHNDGQFGTKEMRFAGTIPDVMVEAYCINNNVTYREVMTNDEHIKRIMQDPAMDHFRVWKGRF